MTVGCDGGGRRRLRVLTWISFLPPWDLAVGYLTLPPDALAVGKRVKSRNFFKPGPDPKILSKKGQNTKFGRVVDGREREVLSWALLAWSDLTCMILTS